MNPNSNLSVCMIVKNEEKMLHDCLASIHDVASEIIIVDTGSEDASIAIAERFGGQVIQAKWADDFSSARNIALDRARFKYILSIDADERVVNPEMLLWTLKNWDDNAGGYVVELTSEAARNDGSRDVYVGYLLRLFVNSPNVRFYGRIHEQIIDSITNQGLSIRGSNIKFNHLGYALSASSMREKQFRNLRLLDMEILQNPKNGEAFYHRAKTYLALGEAEKAEFDVIDAIKNISKDGATHPQALNFGGIIAFRLGEYQKALDRAKQSLAIVPNQSFANFILGETYSTYGEHSEAVKAYLNMREAILNPDPKALIIGDYRLTPEQLAFRIGREYVCLNQLAEAEANFDEGLSVKPNDIFCLVGMANCHYKRGHFSKAKTMLERALAEEPAKEELRSFLAQTIQAEKVYGDKGEPSEKITIQPQEPEKPLITLAMIVRNEERYLEDCLKSAVDVVDEIVLVDTGSNDKTKEIAEKYNARIFDFPWNDDFASARNHAIKQSTGEWILYLDADERLDGGSKDDIRLALKQAQDNVGGFLCLVESEHSQMGGGVELHRAGYPRIFRNYGYPQIQFQGRVHEQITPSIFALGKSISHSEFKIIHIGYNQPREIMEQKIKRNYSLLMKHIQEEPENAYAWFQLGQTLGQMGLMQQSEDAIRFSIGLNKLSPSVYASAAAALAQQAGNTKRFDEALFWSDESLSRAPEQIYAIVLKAYALMYLDRKGESEKCFNEAKSRLLNKRGMPLTGFDIEVPLESIEAGLKKLKN